MTVGIVGVMSGELSDLYIKIFLLNRRKIMNVILILRSASSLISTRLIFLFFTMILSELFSSIDP